MNQQQSKRKKQNREEPEWVVFVFVVVAVAVGILLMAMHQRKTVEFSTEAVSLEYPASWIREVSFSGNAETLSRNIYTMQSVFKARALRSESNFSPRMEVNRLLINQFGTMNPTSTMTEAVTWLTMRYSQSKSHFEVFEVGPKQIAGYDGVLMEYSFVSDAVPSSVRKSFPVPVYGIDFLIQMENPNPGEKKELVYLFTYLTSAANVDDAFSELKRIMETLTLEGTTRKVRS